MRALAFALPSCLLALSLPALVACAPGDGGGDAGSDAGAADLDVYSPGMTKSGDVMRFVLVEADPAPPDVTDNTWTLQVTDLDGEPLAGLDLLLTPFMPAHDHGTTPPDFASTPTANEGEHTIGPFPIIMPGVWELTVTADDGASLSDEVVFRFDVEG